VQVKFKNDLLLTKGDNGLTAWEIDALNGNKEVLDKLWCWSRKVQLNLRDRLLLTKGLKGLTAWVIAAGRGNKKILEKLWFGVQKCK
jgi:hypothetical protein